MNKALSFIFGLIALVAVIKMTLRHSDHFEFGGGSSETTTPPPKIESNEFKVTSSTSWVSREIKGRNLEETYGLEVSGRVHVYLRTLGVLVPYIVCNRESIYGPGRHTYRTLPREEFRNADEIVFVLPKYYGRWDLFKNKPLPDEPVTVRLRWD